MPQAQTVSIDKIRADTVVAWRGLVMYTPVFCLVPLVTSCRRRMIDYVLALRIMLHQVQMAVPHQPKS
jgi:hypothetical protein